MASSSAPSAPFPCDGPPGATYCSPEAINDHGDIVGFCDQRQLRLFTMWRRTGEVVNVGSVPEGASARAVDVTNHGVVLVTTEEPDSGRRILLWKDGVVTDVTNPRWNPTALNERNVIAGWGGTYPEFAAVIVAAARLHDRQRCRHQRTRRRDRQLRAHAWRDTRPVVAEGEHAGAAPAPLTRRTSRLRPGCESA